MQLDYEALTRPHDHDSAISLLHSSALRAGGRGVGRQRHDAGGRRRAVPQLLAGQQAPQRRARRPGGGSRLPLTRRPPGRYAFNTIPVTSLPEFPAFFQKSPYQSLATHLAACCTKVLAHEVCFIMTLGVEAAAEVGVKAMRCLW